MSYAAERWARSQTVGNSTAKAVLRELAFYHNGQTGLCCPSVSKIARVLEVKKADTITAAIKRLEEGGFISREFIRDPETGQILRTEYALIGFVASEWVSSKNQGTSPEDQGTPPEDQGTSPENQGTSPENRGTVPQKRGRGSPEKGGEGYPENQDVTRNKNKEEEQGIGTGNSLPAQAPWETTDQLSADVKKIEKPKKTVDRGSRLSITELPDDWKAFAEQEEPDLDPKRLFENFKDYWNGLSGAKAIKKDWKGTWRNFVRSFHNAEDWKRRPMLKRAPTHSPSRPGQFVEKKQSERDYFDW